MVQSHHIIILFQHRIQIYLIIVVLEDPLGGREAFLDLRKELQDLKLRVHRDFSAGADQNARGLMVMAAKAAVAAPSVGPFTSLRLRENNQPARQFPSRVHRPRKDWKPRSSSRQPLPVANEVYR